MSTEMLSMFTVPYVSTGAQLRVFGTFEEPLFIEVDIKRMLDVDKLYVKLDDEYLQGPILKIETTGGIQKVKTVTEAGLYYIISRSKNPISRMLNKWLLKDVVPSIRKTGGYVAEGEVKKQIDEVNASLNQRIDENKLLFDNYTTVVAENQQLVTRNAELEVKAKKTQEIQYAVDRIYQANETRQEAAANIQEAEKAIENARAKLDEELDKIKEEHRRNVHALKEIIDTNISIKRKMIDEIEDLEDKIDGWNRNIKRNTKQFKLSLPSQ